MNTDINNDSVETLPTSVEVNSNNDLTSNNDNQTLVAEGSCSPTTCSASGLSDMKAELISEAAIKLKLLAEELGEAIVEGSTEKIIEISSRMEEIRPSYLASLAEKTQDSPNID